MYIIIIHVDYTHTHSNVTPHFQEVPPPEVKRRRKRQLIFFDPETQISQEALQQQIDNPLYETRRLPPFSSVKSFSAAHLLNNPCNCQ